MGSSPLEPVPQRRCHLRCSFSTRGSAWVVMQLNSLPSHWRFHGATLELPRAHSALLLGRRDPLGTVGQYLACFFLLGRSILANSSFLLAVFLPLQIHTLNTAPILALESEPCQLWLWECNGGLWGLQASACAWPRQLPAQGHSWCSSSPYITFPSTITLSVLHPSTFPNILLSLPIYLFRKGNLRAVFQLTPFSPMSGVITSQGL